MILIDSSVLIDILNNRHTLETGRFTQLVRDEAVVGIGDLMLIEVLQGIRADRAFRAAVDWLARFDQLSIAAPDIALAAAANYRALRSKGITVRKTIDTLIATRCIVDDIPLLYADRDFDPFVEHFGLRSALTLATL